MKKIVSLLLVLILLLAGCGASLDSTGEELLTASHELFLAGIDMDDGNTANKDHIERLDRLQDQKSEFQDFIYSYEYSENEQNQYEALKELYMQYSMTLDTVVNEKDDFMDRWKKLDEAMENYENIANE